MDTHSYDNIKKNTNAKCSNKSILTPTNRLLTERGINTLTSVKIIIYMKHFEKKETIKKFGINKF